ncbi:hypothetical protein ACOMHN_049052 [Nucella lapillus]
MSRCPPIRHDMSEIEAIPETEEPIEMTEFGKKTSGIDNAIPTSDVIINVSSDEVTENMLLDNSRRSTCVDGPILVGKIGGVDDGDDGDVILTDDVGTKKEGGRRQVTGTEKVTRP